MCFSNLTLRWLGPIHFLLNLYVSPVFSPFHTDRDPVQGMVTVMAESFAQKIDSGKSYPLKIILDIKISKFLHFCQLYSVVQQIE